MKLNFDSTGYLICPVFWNEAQHQKIFSKIAGDRPVPWIEPFVQHFNLVRTCQDFYALNNSGYTVAQFALFIKEVNTILENNIIITSNISEKYDCEHEATVWTFSYSKKESEDEKDQRLLKLAKWDADFNNYMDNLNQTIEDTDRAMGFINRIYELRSIKRGELSERNLLLSISPNFVQSEIEEYINNLENSYLNNVGTFLEQKSLKEEIEPQPSLNQDEFWSS